MDVLDRIKEQVESNPIILYMKGTPQFPQCGFSSRAADALKSCGERFAYVNVLADPEIFENLPRFADWPTFPQIYIDGELFGGVRGWMIRDEQIFYDLGFQPRALQPFEDLALETEYSYYNSQVHDLIIKSESDSRLQWLGGFFCPCHGSKFDYSGRVYAGVPAPTNLEIPPHRFVNDNVVLVGEDGEA